MAGAVTNLLAGEEREERIRQVTKAIRLNQSEGLEPTPELLAVTARYIDGEITFDEMGEIILSW